MKKAFALLIAFFCAFLLCPPALGADTDAILEEQLEESGYYSLFSVLPEEAEDYFADGFSADDLEDITSGSLLEAGLSALKEWGLGPLKLLASLLAVTLLSALLSSFGGDRAASFHSVIALTMAVLLANPVVEAVRGTAKAVKGLSAFLYSFLPVFAASAAASGKPASALVWYGTTLSAVELFSMAVSGLVLPLCCIFIALGLISALAPDLQAGALIRSVKSLALWILSFCLTVFLALLTIKTSVSGAADGVTLKTAKFLLSSAVPVVGGAVGDAWAAVSGCLGLVKSTIGVFGVVVIGVVFLPQILSLGLLSGALKLGAAAAETFSESRPAEVMKSAAGAVSIMLSIVICYAVMLLGALAMVLLARS